MYVGDHCNILKISYTVSIKDFQEGHFTISIYQQNVQLCKPSVTTAQPESSIVNDHDHVGDVDSSKTADKSQNNTPDTRQVEDSSIPSGI